MGSAFRLICLGMTDCSHFSCSNTVSKGIEKWTLCCKEDVDPRTSFNLGNALRNGETVVECLARLDFEVNHFFFPEHKNCSPAKMKPSKRAGYDRVFGILGEHAEYHYCCSCGLQK